MKIVISTVKVPFIYGGAEYLASNLKKSLVHRGHEVEIIEIPFKWYPDEIIPEQILANSLLKLDESNGVKIDLFIGLKFPAYCIQHSNKVLWILHQHRQAYDLWSSDYSDMQKSPYGLNVKQAITLADNKYINEAKKITTISKNVSSRLNKYNKIKSKVLYPPCPGIENLYCDKYNNYFIYISRLNATKRQHLVIEAMKFTQNDTKLYIIGKEDEPNYLKMLQKSIDSNNLSKKVIIKSHLSEYDKYKLYANCRGVIFTPIDEDLGFITLEAFYSQKPVITCVDSGGPTEFVQNNETGYIVNPSPKTIAEKIDLLAESELYAKKLGENAYDFIKGLDITWDRVVEELTTI